MTSPITIEIKRPELVALLREQMRHSDFDVEAMLEGALQVRTLMASLQPEAPRATLLTVGAAASDTEVYLEQAKVIDLAVALKKSDFNTKKNIAILMLLSATSREGPYVMAARIAHDFFRISIHPNTLADYWRLLKSSNSDAEIGVFLKRASENPELRAKLVASATNYDEIARIVAAHGLAKSATELERYLSSWRFLTTMMKGLLDRGAITEAQFKDRAGFASADFGLAGIGQEIDLSIMGGVLSATGWAGKLTGMGSAKIPMAAIIFPATAVIVGGVEGRTFSFAQLGDMFAQSFQLALEGMVAALDELRGTFSGVFG